LRTQLLGQLELDQAKLAEDLQRSLRLHYSEPYPEFLCGRPWKSVMLWAPGGDVGDDIIAHYDASKPSGVTAHGKQLPYIRQIIEDSFAIENVTFARLAVITDSVMVPHRDYVELSDPVAAQRAAHRLHVCLATSEDCLFSEADTIYRMDPGEVWFLDVTELHSAGVLSDFRRVHLILDFADVSDGQRLLKFDVTSSAGIPERKIRPRPPLPQAEREGLLSMASVFDQDNLMEVFGIVIKKHFRKDGGPDFVWDTMEEIARRSGNEANIAKVAQMYKHCVLERVE
jgi:hypothetical protein